MGAKNGVKEASTIVDSLSQWRPARRQFRSRRFINMLQRAFDGRVGIYAHVTACTKRASDLGGKQRLPLTSGCARCMIVRKMKAVFAVVIAALSAVESFLLASLFISLFVAPGGGGEFTGINRLGYTLFAFLYLPMPVFLVVFILVWKYYKPENHRDFRSFTWALAVAVVLVPIVLVFKERGFGTPWHLIINALVLAVWTLVILWRRLTRDEDSSLDSAS